MSAFLSELKKVVRDLDDLSLDWALVGGLACGVYAEPRTTKDIDIAIICDHIDQEEKIVDQLLQRGYHHKQLLMHINPTFRLGVRLNILSDKPYAVPLDLLFSSSGIEDQVVRAAQTIELLPGLFVPVACRGHMIAMKVVSQDDDDRIQDKVDLKSLIKGASQEDLLVAKEALSLITERGHNRGKNLILELESFVKARKNRA